MHDEVQECLKSFSEATSWVVSVRPNIDEGGRNKGNTPNAYKRGTPSRWRLLDTIVSDGILDGDDLIEVPSVSMQRAQQLLNSIERLVERLERAEETVRRQEAELATAIGISSNSDRQRETADRLESILDSVCRSVGAVAGAVYLLNDETTSLKMRSCIGLPPSRLTEPPRELAGSLADLEALLGNAVLLSDIAMMPEWPSPEDFASALVVPIGSSTMPHGTMWFWSDKSRSYSATEIEVANLAAGRVMSEIEQSVLGEEVQQSRVVQKQIDTASITQASMLPDCQILHEDYDINGWTFQNGTIGGAFHHWDLTPQEMMTIAVGNATQFGPEGALVSTSIQSITRTLWTNGSNPHHIMRMLNDTLWSMNDADWTASLALMQLNPSTGYGSICTAGNVHAFIVSSRGFRPLGTPRTRIAMQPDTLFASNRFILQPGEILVAFTEDVVLKKPNTESFKPRSTKGFPTCQLMDQNTLLQIVRDMSDESANDITGYLARTLPTFDRNKESGADRSLVLVKNIRKAIK